MAHSNKNEERHLWTEFNSHFQNRNRTREPTTKANHHDFIQWEGGRNTHATPEVNFRLGSIGASQRIRSTRGLMTE